MSRWTQRAPLPRDGRCTTISFGLAMPAAGDKMAMGNAINGSAIDPDEAVVPTFTFAAQVADADAAQSLSTELTTMRADRTSALNAQLGGNALCIDAASERSPSQTAAERAFLHPVDLVHRGSPTSANAVARRGHRRNGARGPQAHVHSHESTRFMPPTTRQWAPIVGAVAAILRPEASDARKRGEGGAGGSRVDPCAKSASTSWRPLRHLASASDATAARANAQSSVSVARALRTLHDLLSSANPSANISGFLQRRAPASSKSNRGPSCANELPTEQPWPRCSARSWRAWRQHAWTTPRRSSTARRHKTRLARRRRSPAAQGVALEAMLPARVDASRATAAALTDGGANL